MRMGPASDSDEPDTTYEVITDTSGIVRLDISKEEEAQMIFYFVSFCPPKLQVVRQRPEG